MTGSDMVSRVCCRFPPLQIGFRADVPSKGCLTEVLARVPGVRDLADAIGRMPLIASRLRILRAVRPCVW